MRVRYFTLVASRLLRRFSTRVSRKVTDIVEWDVRKQELIAGDEELKNGALVRS